MVSGTHLIEPHTTYLIESEDWHKSEALGRVEYVTPYAHHMALYGVYTKDVAHLENYEAAFNYFPINRNDENAPDDYIDAWYLKAPADYVIAWYPPDTPEFRAQTADHEIIYETKYLQLYRKKRAPGPMLDLWDKTDEGNLIIRFDMQHHNSKPRETAPDYHAIGPNTAYESGKFGWRTRAPYEAYRDGRRQEPVSHDAVWSQRDAAFKLDLPNGTYRVTNTFAAAIDATHTVNLIANGTPILKDIYRSRRRRSASAHLHHRSYGGLPHASYFYTQGSGCVMKTNGNRRDHFWIWNGCTVEQTFFKLIIHKEE